MVQRYKHQYQRCLRCDGSGKLLVLSSSVFLSGISSTYGDEGIVFIRHSRTCPVCAGGGLVPSVAQSVCEECAGEGTVFINYRFLRLIRWTRKVRCIACRGTGFHPEKSG